MTIWLILNSFGLAVVGVLLFLALRQIGFILHRVSPLGARSTTALGRAVLAAALRPVDEPGAAAVERATAWRSDYPAHFRRLVEAGLPDPKSWLTNLSNEGDADVEGTTTIHIHGDANIDQIVSDFSNGQSSPMWN